MVGTDAAGPARLRPDASPSAPTQPAGRTDTSTSTARPSVLQPTTGVPVDVVAATMRRAAPQASPLARPTRTSAAAKDARSASDSARCRAAIAEPRPATVVRPTKAMRHSPSTSTEALPRSSTAG